MNKDELIPTFGSIIGNEIINGTAHSTVDKAGNNQTGEVDVEVTFNVLDDVDKTTYGRNGEFFFRFYDKDLVNSSNKILEEYDLEMNIEDIGGMLGVGSISYDKFGKLNIVQTHSNL